MIDLFCKVSGLVTLVVCLCASFGYHADIGSSIAFAVIGVALFLLMGWTDMVLSCVTWLITFPFRIAGKAFPRQALNNVIVAIAFGVFSLFIFGFVTGSPLFFLVF